MSPQTITTIITLAASYDLVDIDVVAEELGTTVGDEPVIRRLISRASAAIAQYCNRVFVAEVVKDDIWPQRDPYPWQIPGGVAPLQLTRWPIVQVSSVAENGIALIDGTDFRIDRAKGQLTRLDGSGYPRKWPAFTIAVQYKGGYEAIPADIQDAALRMVRARWLGRHRDPMLRQESIPGVRDVTYWIAAGDSSGNMPPDVTDILDNYRAPIVVS
jgi:hypothetical protein